ncbi:MAG: HEAT repeat domain-containing protein [Myxococcota bacterium]|nr:HEAT repeat domain-containing protein [Myxococcota bacterium]
MDVWWSMIALVALFALAFLLSRAFDARQVDDDLSDVQPDRIRGLLIQLRLESERQQRLLNQILALGPDIVPAVIKELRTVRAHEDPSAAHYLASLETLLSDFGLVAVPPICHELGRLPFGSPVIGHLTRALHRIGPSAIRPVLTAAARSPSPAPHLLSVLNRWPDEAIHTVFRRMSASDSKTLMTVLAPIYMGQHSRLISLWESACVEKRTQIINWATDWQAASLDQLIERALVSHDSGLRQSASRAARLTHSQKIIDTLVSAWNGSTAEQKAFVEALVSQGAKVEIEGLIKAGLIRSAETLADALCALVTRPDAPISLAASQVDLSGSNLPALLVEGKTINQWNIDSLFAFIEAGEDPMVRFYIHALALQAGAAPRIRERLIRLAETGHGKTKTWAILALAKNNDEMASDVLIRAIRIGDDDMDYFTLREAAQYIGPSLNIPLFRRFAEHRPHTQQQILCIVRSLTGEDTVDYLLHALEDVRQDSARVELIQTMASSERVGRATIHHALKQQRKGLVLPALRFLAAHCKASDAPLLLHVYDNQLTLRSLVLSVLESLGPAAIDAMEQHIQAGGDDLALEALEHRLLILDQCLNYFGYDEEATQSTA